MKLLTEPEAAEILRCDRQKVKRLRLSGKLPYIPGRPVLIDEADLFAYIEHLKAKGKKPSASPWRKDETTAAARQWALEAVLFRRGPRKPSRSN